MLPVSAVFVGLTAAWMNGLDVEPASPVEVALPGDDHLRSRAGLHVHHCSVADDVVKIRGLPATNLCRTLLDLCARLPAVDALVAIDMALHARLIDQATLRPTQTGPRAAAAWGVSSSSSSAQPRLSHRWKRDSGGS